MEWEFYTTSKETWQAMKKALSQSQSSIYLESFIFLDDAIGREFVDILVEKAQQGVEVKLILDGVGSFWFSALSLKRLRDAGAHVLSFQSLAFRRVVKSFRRLLHRNHRKTLIIDKQVGFIGGVNLKKAFEDWHDLHVQISGREQVAPMVRSFGKTWVLGGGSKSLVTKLINHPVTQVKKSARVVKYIFSHPYKRFKERSRVRRLYISALEQARQRVLIATPYFLPDSSLLDAMAKAARRGVMVQVILPRNPDIKIVTYAMHSLFPRLNAMGIDLYLTDKMMHGKAMVVDHNLGMVGSSNIDPRSFFYNHEANITFAVEQMVAELEEILKTWRAAAWKFDPKGWGKQSWYVRMLRWLGELVSPIL